MNSYRILNVLVFLAIAINLEASETKKMETQNVLKIIGPWSIQIGPEKWHFDNKSLSIPKPVILEVTKPEIKTVRNEKYQLPVFNETKGYWGWLRGVKLNALATQECSATDLLIPGSVKVKVSADSTTFLTENKDYKVETQWASIGRLPNSVIQENQTVYVDYDYSPCRLDSVVIDQAGQIRLIQGISGVGCVQPPTIGKGETLLANIWIPGRTEKLTENNLFPVLPDLEKSVNKHAIAEKLLPKTLAKLREGKPLTILAWGDSVTNGGYLKDPEKSRYQTLFVEQLRKRFPKSKITLLTVSWPGAASISFLEAPRGSEHDFAHLCLEPKPDLVTIEFVNDAPYNLEGFTKTYTTILNKFRGIGSEMILITPHFVRPDWMGITTLKVNEDPRPYVKYLKDFSKANKIALADASRYWAQLWRKGIPYTIMLTNSINHPDERGHEIFAQSLIELFPEK